MKGTQGCNTPHFTGFPPPYWPTYWLVLFLFVRHLSIFSRSHRVPLLFTLSVLSLFVITTVQIRAAPSAKIDFVIPSNIRILMSNKHTYTVPFHFVSLRFVCVEIHSIWNRLWKIVARSELLFKQRRKGEPERESDINVYRDIICREEELSIRWYLLCRNSVPRLFTMVLRFPARKLEKRKPFVWNRRDDENSISRDEHVAATSFAFHRRRRFSGRKTAGAKL